MAIKGMLGAALYGSTEENASEHHAFVSDAACLTHAPRVTGMHSTFTAFLPNIGSSNHDSHEHFLCDAPASHTHDGSSDLLKDFIFGQERSAKRAGRFTAFNDNESKDHNE
mmetsp:Transcript_46703/g.81198  ORF Transcript_46703/g.81198 Transcript_46703/m.81198 type:complete len:111 (+) Transcript_46703:94-426(+)